MKQNATKTNFNRVRDVITNLLMVDDDEVTPASSLKDDLNADSLDITELIMDTEEEFDISISDEDGEKVKTPQDLVNLVERMLAKKLNN